MKALTLLNLTLTLSLVGAMALPACADQVAAVNQPTVSPTTVNQSSTIPQSSAIIVAFPTEVTLDGGADRDYPMTLLLAQPIWDNYGNMVAPQNSPISVRLQSKAGSIQVIAESLVVKGRVVPIQASSAVIPGNTVTVTSGLEKAKENSSLGVRLGGLALGAMNGGDAESIKQGALIGSGLGILTGLISSKEVSVVKIPQGSVYVLTLQATVTLTFTTVTSVQTGGVNPQQ
jgi:hypothetical protein